MAKSSQVAPRETLTITGLLGDFRLLLILFVSFRLMLVLVYQPLIIQGNERGMSAGGDFQTYFQLGSFSEDGLLPFRDWWSEFPPIPSVINVVLNQLTNQSYSGFAMLYGLLMLAIDIGNLILVRRIGTRLHGANTGMALAWVYALLLAPLVISWWAFEGMAAFALLLALNWLLEKRDIPSAVAAGIGALIKFTPALLIGAALRFRPPRLAVRYLLIVSAIFGGVYLLLFAQNAAMTVPSLTAQFSKASYQTVWALLDGNYRTGNFGAAADRLDPANANVLQGNPPVIPGWLRLLAAAAIGVFVYARTRRFDERGIAAFVAITLLIFFLQAQGWSPQWLAQIIPLLLLCFPTRDGIIGLILLSFVTFAEYPFLFIRTGDTNGVITGSLVPLFVILILVRTGILVVYALILYRKLRQEAAA
jgi:hypothetical protein